MSSKFLPLLLAASFFQGGELNADTLSSPDGNVSAEFNLNNQGRLQYEVSFNDTVVVEPSDIGITINGVDLGIGVTLGTPAISEMNETYVTRGNDSEARNHYKAWRYPVTHKESGKAYSLEFRAYDDGIAYRYIVPGQGVQHVDGESSSWKLAKGTKTWFFERKSNWKLMSYAGEWISEDIDQMETISPQGPVQGAPLLFEIPRNGGYAVATKAALYDYSGMRLKAVGDRTFVADFSEGEDGFDVDGVVLSPWRVTLLAEDLNELVNSDLIENLNPAADVKLFADQSYIKPGRSVWSWESVGLGTPETQKEYIDMAAKIGFEYSIVDDGWKEWDNPWETMASLADHGRGLGVDVMLWVDSKDIRNPENDYEELKVYFDKVVAAGVVGVKIDFMNSESKEMVDFEIAVLRIGAERELLINFHGCHASTGETRTYPNEITREGIRGIEVNKHGDGPLPLSHNAALPFTRFVVGHADYTPILYTNPGPTSLAQQLAMAVVTTSPLQVYSEHPETMMSAPAVRDGIGVLQAIPTNWDETVVLKGSKIGDLAAMARRSGDDWFVALVNGADARDYSLDLSFLGEGKYVAEMVSDDLEAAPVDVEKIGVNMKAVGKRKQWKTSVPFKVNTETVNRSKTLKVELADGGGFVAVFRKE